MSKKLWIALGAIIVLIGGAVAIFGNSSSSSSKNNASIALITDGGGIDDKSFQQSAWEGMEKWGKANGLKQGKGGYTYYESKTTADFTTNMEQAVSNDFKTIFGIGFKLTDAINTEAKKNTDTNFVIVDDVAKKRDNVASVTFHSEESSYLAGVAAAKTTKTNHIGFVGGMNSAVIDMFEAGYVAGAQSVNPDIQIDIQYVGDFTSASKAKTIAASMYAGGADIIYQAAGGAGAGVFTEAKDLNTKQAAADKVWVIGVDLDQKADGAYTATDGKSNFTLTSSLKGVGAAVADIATDAKKGKFPGGKTITYGLSDGGVSVTRGNMSADAWKAVQAAEKDIKDGKITVPSAPTK
jgi:basic membrane protein A